MATQVISRARDALGVELSLSSFFDQPTIAALAAQVESRMADQRQVEAPLMRVPRAGRLPLSFAQQRLWFLDRLVPDSAFYNVAMALRLSGPLNVVALEQSLNQVLQRHEILRTTIQADGGMPAQFITEPVPVNLAVEQFPTIEAGACQEFLQQTIDGESKRPFDLSRGPLIRTRLLRQRADEHLLLITMHHVVSDGWSLGVLVQELSQLYGSFASSRPSPLPELEIQYADYAAWQRAWLQGSVLENQLQFWRQKLAGLPTLQLHADRPRPPRQTFQGAAESLLLPRSLSDQLQALSRHEGATLFMTLLAAFQLLLSRYTGQDDIVVGSPIAGRRRAQLEKLIGFFVNMLVLRTDVSGDPTFRQLLKRVGGVATAAYEHQDIPFEKLVEELEPERDLSRNPLFQVLFALQNAPLQTLQLAGLTLSWTPAEIQVTRFDLETHVWDTGDGLRVDFVYSISLFEAATIRQLARHYQRLLECIVAHPDEPVSSLPLLTAVERAAVLSEWNATEVDYGTRACLPELFEQQVARTPDATALVFDKDSVTYQELNQRANRLAHHLISLGVGPDRLVGVRLQRSLEMVVALLGILKAGGAYVPIDPDHPQQRQDFMLSDSGAVCVLTDGPRADLRLDSPVPEILLQRGGEQFGDQPDANPRSESRDDHLAYVIYTSGTTGRPKGAMIDHRGIRNRLLWMQEAYGLDGSDRVLQKTPFSFDVSVWEFFGPLIAGATLVVADPEGHRDPRYLVRTIREQRITTVHFVPSMLAVFLQVEEVQSCRGLRRVLCSGEALTLDLQNKYFERLQAPLHNLYGPTEASVEVTAWRCEPDRGLVPIGRPISNIQTYVLDDRLSPEYPIAMSAVIGSANRMPNNTMTAVTSDSRARIAVATSRRPSSSPRALSPP